VPVFALTVIDIPPVMCCQRPSFNNNLNGQRGKSSTDNGI
jgi:hypothetical protein